MSIQQYCNSLAEAYMISSDPNTPLIFVEGKADKIILDDFIQENVVVRFPKNQLNNKAFVIDTILDINRRSINSNKTKKRIIGIIDSDFFKIQKKGSKFKEIENLFTTYFHDLEVSVFNSKAFPKLLNSLYFISEQEDYKINKIHKLILSIAKIYGLYFLAISDTKLVELKKIIRPIYKYITDNSKLDDSAIERDIKNSHVYQNLDKKIQEKFKFALDWRRKPAYFFDTLQIINGHDLIKVLLKLTVLPSSELSFRFELKDVFNKIRSSLNTDIFKECEELIALLNKYVEKNSEDEKIKGFLNEFNPHNDYFPLKMQSFLKKQKNVKKLLDLIESRDKQDLFLKNLDELKPNLDACIECYKFTSMLETILRGFYQLQWFRETDLYKSIKNYGSKIGVEFLK